MLGIIQGSMKAGINPDREEFKRKSTRLSRAQVPFCDMLCLKLDTIENGVVSGAIVKVKLGVNYRTREPPTKKRRGGIMSTPGVNLNFGFLVWQFWRAELPSSIKR